MGKPRNQYPTPSNFSIWKEARMRGSFKATYEPERTFRVPLPTYPQYAPSGYNMEVPLNE